MLLAEKLPHDRREKGVEVGMGRLGRKCGSRRPGCPGNRTVSFQGF